MSTASDAATDRCPAPFGRRRCEVATVERAGAYTVLTVVDPDAGDVAPGQFSMLAAAEGWGESPAGRPLLSRAFSVLRRRDGLSQYLLEEVGPGTARLCRLDAGEGVWVLGPLGRGFSAPEEGRRAILAGGGAGIAPLAIWDDALRAGGTPAEVLLGFRDAAHAEAARLFEQPGVATDDGTVGHRGRVTELLAAAVDADPHATVYACGPPPMLEAVRQLCGDRDVPSQLALEAPMACGFGACFGCVVALAEGGYARVCVDGPVLPGAALGPIGAHA